MKFLPVNPTADQSPDKLRAFIEQCRDTARSAKRAQLVSISLEVDALDPLAVLESIYEARALHFYAERPGAGFAVAGAEAVMEFTAQGPARFGDAREFISQTLAHTIAVGAVDAPFGGPHFFLTASFFHDVPPGAAFPALRLFVPRWQVSRTADGSVAVANFVVAPDAPVDLITAKVWGAHAKFSSFDYRCAAGSGRPEGVIGMEEILSDGGYRTCVTRALAGIARGDYRKIVLARAMRLTASGDFHPLGVLNALRQRFPACCSFSVADGTGGSFIGATPEQLVRVADGRMHTEALAGSAPRGATASEDAALAKGLLHSEKDLREHALVLDSIIRRLADVGLNLERSPQARILPLANVQHLQTPVSAALPEGTHILDLIERLHPTPAVGGTPREPAMEAIGRFEAFHRGLYAGPVGWIDWRGGGEIMVGLRSAMIEGPTATVYAGAGIVEGSDPDKEFAETELKFQALLEALVAK